MPKITVLMPVYNGERYLPAAVESILCQTYSDFEFLIINDGSTDRTQKILESYRDPRVRIIHQENKGVAASLRLGVDLSQGEYIARMDADDESISDRLGIQKKVLDQNPQACLVHGMHDLIDENGHIIRGSCGLGWSKEETKWLLLWGNVITHPTVMIRAKTLKEHQLNYRMETNGAEDFDLWNRLSSFGEFLYIPKVFLRYRLNPNGVNRVNLGERQFRGYLLVILENFMKFGLSISSELAEEIVVISGQTMKNPLTYPYRFLPEVLPALSKAIFKRFSDRMSIEPKKIVTVLSLQMVRWARCLLQSSKKGSLNLLMAAFLFHRQMFFNRIFLLTFSALFLPNGTLNRINNRRTRPLI